MSTDAISPLRQRMIEDMSARKLNPHTQRSHISSCKRFAAYLKRSPGTATADEIRLFQLHLTESASRNWGANGGGSATVNRCQSASDRDPRSASNRDPLVLRFGRLALAPSELVGVAETGRARVCV